MYKVNASDMTLNYLIEVSGTSLQDLINEIRKLIEYVGENGTITEKDVDMLASKQIESVIWDLTNSIAEKKTEKVLEVLNNLIYKKEPYPVILKVLYDHFKKLYLCKQAVKLNKDVVTALGLKPNQTFLVPKYKKQVTYFKGNDLRNILEEISNLDYNSKIGNIDAEVGLKSILCRFC